MEKQTELAKYTGAILWKSRGKLKLGSPMHRCNITTNRTFEFKGMDSSATKQGTNGHILWTRKWTFHNHKRRDFLITRVERRTRIVVAISFRYLSRKGLRHSARQELACITVGWLTAHLTCVCGWNQSANEVTFVVRALESHSAWEHDSTKCRISPVASRHLKPDNTAICITCGWDLRRRPDWPQGPPRFLHNGYTNFPRGKAAAVWCWSPISFQMPCCKWVRATPPPPFGACMSMSWGDLHCIYVMNYAMNYPTLVRYLIVSNAPGYSNNRTADVIMTHGKIAVVISKLYG